MNSRLARSPRPCAQTLVRGYFYAREKGTWSSFRSPVMLVRPALLCKRRYIDHFRYLWTAYLIYRISFPAPPFRGVTSSPLRTAFSIGVAPSRTNVRPNNSALPLSVNTSVALAICVLDTGFDGRGGREINEVRLLGGVDGRGCGCGCGIGGAMILVDFATGR